MASLSGVPDETRTVRKLGEYTGTVKVHTALLNVIVHDQKRTGA